MFLAGELNFNPRIKAGIDMPYRIGSSLTKYYTFTLDNLRPFSNGHLSMEHLSWQHLSISAIYQLLLAWFWPNFKCRFLGISLTEANCYNDICPGTICPGNICPYHWYLSYYWPNFDHTFLNQHFFGPNFCLT